MLQRRLVTMLVAAALFLTLRSPAMAANLTWDADTGTGGIQDGSGSWFDGGTNWDNGGNVAWNNATPDTAIIGSGNGAAGTITLTGPIVVDDITFNAPGSGSYVVTGNTLTLAGAGTPTITSNANARIDSQLSGSLGFIKQGTSTLTLGGANDYTGTTEVNAGVLNIQNASALGSNAQGTIVANGAALQLQGGIVVVGEALTPRGQGLTGDGDSGALRSISGNNEWSGNFSIDLAATVSNGAPITPTRIASDAGNLLISGNINVGPSAVGSGVTFGVQGNGTGEISGDITGGKAGVQTFFRSSLGSGMWTLSGNNTYLGYTAVNGPLTITGGNAIPDTSLVAFNSGLGALTLNASETIGSLISANVATAATIQLGSNTLTVGADNTTPSNPFNNSANGSYWGRILGAGGNLTKIGAGTLRLAGNTANTYSGLTSVNAGTLALDKSSGNAIGGDLLIQGGNLTYIAGRSNQIADSATITMTGAASTFNSAYVASITETFANLTMTGGLFGTGGGSNWNVTGTASFTGGGSGNPRFVGNSGSGQTFNSLILTGMNATTGAGNPANSFALFGNSPTQTRLTVGAGGLTMNDSNIFVRKGTDVGTLGARLVLNGNVTTTGSAISRISDDPLTSGLTQGAHALELSGTVAPVNRTFNIGGGADLHVSIPVTNGASSAGGIIKTGAGTLLLTEVNTYTGNTLVNGGVLGGTGAVGSNFTIASGGTLSPGASAGTLLTNDLTMQAGSTLHIELGGLTPGTQHDVVAASGNVSLGGTLFISLINGFTPTPSDTFTIITADEILGTFDSVIAVGSGGNFDVLYFDNMVQLTNFQLVPEPGSLWALCGLLGLAGKRRRARS